MRRSVGKKLEENLKTVLAFLRSSLWSAIRKSELSGAEEYLRVITGNDA